LPTAWESGRVTLTGGSDGFTGWRPRAGDSRPTPSATQPRESGLRSAGFSFAADAYGAAAIRCRDDARWAHLPTRHHLQAMSSPPIKDRPATPAEAADRASIGGPRAWWLRLPPRRRRALQALLAVGVLLVLLISVVLARFLSVENAERDADLALVQAQARGDVAAMLDQISGCRASPSCVAGVKANVDNPRLRRAGAVKILSLKSPTAYSLAGATGKTRLAWTVIGMLPVVQCVDVHRSGNFLTGIHVQLLGLSAPIANEGTCTKRTRAEIEEEEATAVER
jgi:hypothetical protein